MAKIGITIEDTDNPESSFTLDVKADDPGRSCAEMKANPTPALTLTFAILDAVTELSSSYKGFITDDDGSTRELNPENPL
jgi:hypothetical protein